MSDQQWEDEATEYDDENWISKSQLKRDDAALQQFAAELVELPNDTRGQLPLSEDLIAAIDAAQSILKKRGALKRQIKYIGGLLRRVEVEPIREKLQLLQGTSVQATARLHRIEQWRERLIEDGDSALTELVEINPDIDRQQIRQLLRNIQHERSKNKPPKAFRALFQFLKDALP